MPTLFWGSCRRSVALPLPLLEDNLKNRSSKQNQIQKLNQIPGQIKVKSSDLSLVPYATRHHSTDREAGHEISVAGPAVLMSEAGGGVGPTYGLGGRACVVVFQSSQVGPVVGFHQTCGLKGLRLDLRIPDPTLLLRFLPTYPVVLLSAPWSSSSSPCFLFSFSPIFLVPSLHTLFCFLSGLHPRSLSFFFQFPSIPFPLVSFLHLLSDVCIFLLLFFPLEINFPTFSSSFPLTAFRALLRQNLSILFFTFLVFSCVCFVPLQECRFPFLLACLAILSSFLLFLRTSFRPRHFPPYCFNSSCSSLSLLS